MSEMPARIWVKPFAIRSSDIEVKNAVISSLSADVPDNVAFVRADIAERMADALDEICRGLADSGSSPVLRTTLMTKQAAYKIARSALSAWKDGL